MNFLRNLWSLITDILILVGVFGGLLYLASIGVKYHQTYREEKQAETREWIDSIASTSTPNYYAVLFAGSNEKIKAEFKLKSDRELRIYRIGQISTTTIEYGEYPKKTFTVDNFPLKDDCLDKKFCYVKYE